MFLTRKRNKRSNVNLSHVSPTTLAPGNIVPISTTRILSGDKLSFSPKAFVQAFPMNAPLVNGFKVCLEYFFIPDRLYNNDLLLDNMYTTDDPHSVEFPYIQSTGINGTSGNVALGFNFKSITPAVVDIISKIVSPGSLADYLGFPVGMYPTFNNVVSDVNDRNRFNATAVLGYLDIIYHYYANQQIEEIPTALWSPRLEGDPDSPEYNARFSTIWLGELLKRIKSARVYKDALDQWISDFKPSMGRYLPMTWEWFCSRASIYQRCLPPYYLESWLATSGYNDAEVKVDLEADGNSISFRNISAQSHVQRWLDLAFAGGSRYSDYINSEFDVSHLKHTTTPVFLGSDRQYLGSKVIYQTTGAGDTASPLGSFAGQASGGETFKRRSYSFGENGYFMVMASLVPDVIYQRGLNPFLRELTLGDVYAPALDNIAMQPLMVEELDAIPRLKNITKLVDAYVFNVDGDDKYKNTSVGFVPAWSQLLQNVSRAHGRLTTQLNYWLLSRDYGNPPLPSDANFASVRADAEDAYKAGKISFSDFETFIAFLDAQRRADTMNFSPYVLSNSYNDVFADISNQAQNFVLTFAADMSVNREKGKTNVPTTL